MDDTILTGTKLGQLDGGRGDAAIDALAAIEVLGYTLPKPVTTAVKRWHVARARANALPDARAFTADDLGADDWADRLAASAIENEVTATRLRLVTAAERTTRARVGKACAEVLGEAGDWLEGWFIDNLDDLARTEQPRDRSESVARIEDRELALQQFRAAHQALMRTEQAGSAGYVKDYRAEWWITHTWTAEQWAELIDSTGPALGTKTPLTLAISIGATPRLARRMAQPWEDFHALQSALDEAKFNRAFDAGNYAIVGAEW